MLRPGGFLWGLEAFWRTGRLAAIARSVGFENVHVVRTSCYYVAAIPQRAFVARKSIQAGLVLGGDEVADAAATVASLSTSGFPSTAKPGLREMLAPTERRSASAASRGASRSGKLSTPSAPLPPSLPHMARSPVSRSVMLERLRTEPSCGCVSRDGVLQLWGQLVMLGVWLGYLYLLVAYWTTLAIPVRAYLATPLCCGTPGGVAGRSVLLICMCVSQTVVPWSTQVRTQLMQNARVYPLSLYFCFLELRHFIMAKQVRRRGASMPPPRGASSSPCMCGRVRVCVCAAIRCRGPVQAVFHRGVHRVRPHRLFGDHLAPCVPAGCGAVRVGSGIPTPGTQPGRRRQRRVPAPGDPCHHMVGPTAEQPGVPPRRRGHWVSREPTAPR